MILPRRTLLLKRRENIESRAVWRWLAHEVNQAIRTIPLSRYRDC